MCRSGSQLGSDGQSTSEEEGESLSEFLEERPGFNQFIISTGEAGARVSGGGWTLWNFINLVVRVPCQPLAANEDNFPKRSIQLLSHFPFWLFQI